MRDQETNQADSRIPRYTLVSRSRTFHAVTVEWADARVCIVLVLGHSEVTSLGVDQTLHDRASSNETDANARAYGHVGAGGDVAG